LPLLSAAFGLSYSYTCSPGSVFSFENTSFYNNLAELYTEQRKYEEAEPLHEKALEIREKIFGLNNPDIATSYNNLAKLYEKQRKYKKAEQLYKKALGILEKVLGTNHPKTKITKKKFEIFTRKNER
jgi:tetratricopeptide (TPR) repeat protein